jgi:hypothetical protein
MEPAYYLNAWEPHRLQPWENVKRDKVYPTMACYSRQSGIRWGGKLSSTVL